MAIEFIIGAEETHRIGEVGARRVRRWLECTYRFKIDQTIYDLDQHDRPYAKLRLAQLTPPGKPARFERFDLIGALLDEHGRPGNRLYVECKQYASAGKQGDMYDEYLAICYSGFVLQSRLVGAPADLEFMWATTHPFAVTNFANLTTPDQIEKACAAHPERLAGEDFDRSIAEQLAPRLWMAIVNTRVDEMIMGVELQKAVAMRIVELQR